MPNQNANNYSINEYNLICGSTQNLIKNIPPVVGVLANISSQEPTYVTSMGAFGFNCISSKNGSALNFGVMNTSNTNNSNAYFVLDSINSSTQNYQVTGGQTWNLFKTSSLAIRTTTTTRYSIGATGIISEPSQPNYFAVAATANSVTGDGTVYNVIYGGASPYVYTALNSGLYNLQATVGVTNINVNHTLSTLEIVTSNRTYLVWDSSAGGISTAGNQINYNSNILVDLDLGDTATVYFTVSGSTKTVNITASNPIPGLSNFNGMMEA